MNRRELLAVLAGAAGLSGSRASAAALTFEVRRRGEDGVATLAATPWEAERTAVILCDMWNDHYCVSSRERLIAMIPRMNQTTAAARALGMKVIHAPSTTMAFYEGTPQRARMKQAPYVKPPVEIAAWCYLDPKDEGAFPIEDENPCDDPIGREKKPMYNRQHPGLVIAPQDGVSDDGQEIYNYCEQHGLTNIVMMGVHANKCVLGRPFGIRQQVRLGRNVLLVRDLTDSMYDPRDPPYVTHERGTELVIEHTEKYWCGTILSGELIEAAPVASD